MRYRESREKSAELLRAALALMGRHDAAFNPLSFAVWYEYAAATNPRLTEAIDDRLRTEPRFGDETIARLYRDHVGEIDESALQRASGEFQRVITTMAESAARTGDQAGAFGEQLTGLTRVLGTGSPEGIGPVISETLLGTAELKDSVVALQRQVAVSREEIERLRDDLSRARVEALVDPLTGVVNRKGFDQELQAMIDDAHRSGASLCLVMLDVDRFKAVNDSYGHVMGDRVLQAVAEVLRKAAPGATHRVARYGGEEFAILVPQCALGEATELAETCRRFVKAMKVRDRRTQDVVLTVTISAGVASLQPGEDPHGFVARADGALYAAKQAGRDRVNCA